MPQKTNSYALVSIVLLALACDKPQSQDAPESGRVALPEATGHTPPPPIIGPKGRDGSRVQGAGAQGAGAQGASGSEARVPQRAENGGAASASSKSFGAELTRLYESWAAEEKAVVDEFGATLQTAIAQEGVFATALRTLYAGRNGQPVLSRDGVLTEDADALVTAILEVETHGLDPAPYDLPRLKSLVAGFANARVAMDALRSPGGSVWPFVVAQRPAPGARADEAALSAVADEAGLSDGDLASLSEARKHLNALLAGQKSVNAVLAELEAFLAGKLHRWVYDMRFAKKAHPFLADKSDAEGLKRVAKSFAAALAVELGAPGAITTLLASVVPTFPDYEPTRQALARYRGYAAAYPTALELGKEVEKLGPGKSGEAVSKLEVRLIQEEYLSGEPIGKWSATLEKGISEYQETHQLKVTGRVEKIMRTSLNKPFSERVASIALSLQRYRESDLHQGAFRFGETPVRARVNIPGMEARFFLGRELARRHRVIVGNNDNETEADTGKKGKLNQTRLLTAEMQTVVLNPTWNVPKRIKEQELDLLLMDEPDYYEKHNFKVEVNPDGTERVVQQPGPGNALGLVKFLFPNEFSIYMHDTAKKSLFDRSVRAFSHGCMRTEDPLDLARWILVEFDKELTDSQFDDVLAKREERHFPINPRIPISTDYVTTSIDEKGRLVFLADVYGFDRDYFDGKTPYRADKDFPMTIIF